jgi:hypothetical protein
MRVSAVALCRGGALRGPVTAVETALEAPLGACFLPRQQVLLANLYDIFEYHPAGSCPDKNMAGFELEEENRHEQ